MRALVIQHDHVSPPGPVGDRLRAHGYELVCQQVLQEHHWDDPSGVEASFPPATEFDAIVVMGARWSAYDADLIGGWAQPEATLLRQADEAGVPVLGICFGGQMLASVHGGSVGRSPAPELGWVEVASEDDDLVPGGPWFQWHFDRWVTPADATEIARNDAAPQAFRLRRNLAVQFHPELTGAMLDGWLANGGREQLLEHSLDPDALAAETHRQDARSAERAHRLMDGFLDRVARG